MTAPGTSSRCSAGETAADGHPFAAALAAAVPADGFWSMPIVVACSGGADSVALLLALHALAPAGAVPRIVVAHAEHDLREAAPADRQFVVALAERLGLRAEWRRIAVREAVDHRGEGLEGLARRLRYDFLAASARDHGARHVVVGHTRDDQAETILHRMLRGTGLVGLGGMRSARELGEGLSLLRPMLGITRAEARAFLLDRGQAWCEDPSNADTTLARNFLRHEVLSRCAAGPYPAAEAALGRLGRQAALVAGALESAAEHLLRTHASRHADGAVVVRAGPLRSLDRHLLAEVMVAAWRREGWPQRDMTARHYATLAGMLVAAPGSPEAADFPGRVHVRRHADDTLVLRGPDPDPSTPAPGSRPITG
jgi:tRNA(Ile)-lysidine synthase